MNFIVFQPDELRAESVGCYGHPLAPTPNIDALDAQGTRFDQCHVQHTVCSPTRCSMMTGWYPHVRGHRSLWHLLQPHEPNLMRTLRKNGYTTLMAGKNDLFAAESFADSAPGARMHGRQVVGPNPYDIDDPRYFSFRFEPYTGPIEEHIDYACVQAAIDFLESKPTEPFFIFLPLFLPHAPYSAPAHWHDYVNPDDLPPLRPTGLPNRPDYHQLIRQYRWLDQISNDEHDDFLRKIKRGWCRRVM